MEKQALQTGYDKLQADLAVKSKALMHSSKSVEDLRTIAADLDRAKMMEQEQKCRITVMEQTNDTLREKNNELMLLNQGLRRKLAASEEAFKDVHIKN